MPSGNEGQNNREAGHEPEQRRAGDQKSPTVPAGQPSVKENTASPQKERYFAKFSNWVAFFTLIFVMIYTIITFAQWRSNHIFNKKQLRSINTQLAEMQTASGLTRESNTINRAALVGANRPWIKVKEELASDLTYDGNVARIALKFSFYNAGHSPALDLLPVVQFSPCIYNHLMQCDAAGFFPTQLAKLCGTNARAGESLKKGKSEDLSGNLSNLLGRAVFPSDKGLATKQATFEITERSAYGSLSRFLVIDDGDLIPPTMILSCVTYGSSLEDRFYKTGHAFFLERLSGEPDLNLGSKIPISRDQLRLRPAGGEDYVE